MMKAKMFFMSLVTLVAALSFTGCSKDDSDSEQPELTDLIGTVWQYDDEDVTVTLDFVSETDVLINVGYHYDSDNETESIGYTYEYMAPNVVMSPKPGVEGETLYAVVDGLNMYVEDRGTFVRIDGLGVNHRVETTGHLA